MSPARLPAVPWLRNKWGLQYNPFPAEAIAVLGGDNDRENGRLVRPEVQTEQFDEAVGKFVLAAIRCPHRTLKPGTSPTGFGAQSELESSRVPHIDLAILRLIVASLGTKVVELQ